MHKIQPVRHDRASRNEASEAVRQIGTLDNLARKTGTVLSIDRDELLDLLRTAECAGHGR